MFLTIASFIVVIGVLIFVHELGHFLVAKACGVKCEKFYLGFDIYGLKLFHFQWGETEYGIGILPLGGYVKMLGQDDNPNRAAEERERALADRSGDLPHEPTSDPHPKYDPRSYMAQSVPKRMAIISAGVIMNVIFAFVCASVAYSMGREFLLCEISGVTPGEAAWQAGLMPGDRIVQIGEIGEQGEKLRFDDLFTGVALGDVDKGITLKIQRPGMEQPFTVVVRPDKERAKDRGRPTIGAIPPRSTALAGSLPFRENTPAAEEELFKGNDNVIAINGAKVESYADIQRELARHLDTPLQVTVERKKEAKSKDAPPEIEQLTFTMAPNPLRTVGLVMGWGPIVAIQDGSPAKDADLRPGDKLLKVDGQPLSTDPLRFPEQMRRRALSPDKTVKLTIARQNEAGQETELEKTLTLVEPRYFDQPLERSAPVTVPSLGIAYRVTNTMAGIEPGSPADQQGVKPGDQLVKAELIASDENSKKESDFGLKVFEFDDQNLNWLSFMTRLQYAQPDTKVKLTLRRGDKTLDVTMPVVAATEWFFPDRGLVFDALTEIRVAQSVGEAMKLGWRETRDALLLVFRILRKVGSGQLGPSNFGGPGTIAFVAAKSAEGGLSTLLIFLTMLSANLAVINFLPIPILDGGHIFIMAAEGLFRRDFSVRVKEKMLLAGFVVLMMLMVTVIYNDLARITWIENIMPWR
jgi:regulator of sigma E protease